VEETAGGQDILVIDVSRGTVTRAAHGLTEIDRLVWSPDGGRLALGGKSGGRHGIFIARTDGSAPQRVADGRSPSWSPTGRGSRSPPRRTAARRSSWSAWIRGRRTV